MVWREAAREFDVLMQIDSDNKIRELKTQSNKVANVELTVQTEHHDDLALHIMACLKEEVDVSIIERQVDAVDEMNQAVG